MLNDPVLRHVKLERGDEVCKCSRVGVQACFTIRIRRAPVGVYLCCRMDVQRHGMGDGRGMQLRVFDKLFVFRSLWIVASGLSDNISL